MDRPNNIPIKCTTGHRQYRIRESLSSYYNREYWDNQFPSSSNTDQFLGRVVYQVIYDSVSDQV